MRTIRLLPLLLSAAFSAQSIAADTLDIYDIDRIMAAAKAAGVVRIDYLVMTHYHGDHVGGFLELSKLIPIEHFVDHGQTVQPEQNSESKQAYLAAQAQEAQTNSALDAEKAAAYKLRDDLLQYTLREREFEDRQTEVLKHERALAEQHIVLLRQNTKLTREIAQLTTELHAAICIGRAPFDETS